MAIKERKQITGTEAQIKGYAGHNGVLAYATDTKHLHVLSGTAGTTTKLANMSDIPAPVDISGKADKTYVDTELTKKQPKGDYATNTALTQGLAGKADKTYVDTELTKKQPKGDYTTNTALTQGLAGLTEALNKKENAGVCLPLTGGTLTGPLYLTETNHIFAVVEDSYKGLELGGGSTYKNGATLFLRNNNATGPKESGQWGLAAHNATSAKEGLLIGNTDNILFNGKVVERADGFYTSQFTGGFCNVHRYATGLQIVIAAITIPVKKRTVTLTFPKPFIDNSYSITTSKQSYSVAVELAWDSPTATSIGFYRRAFEEEYSFTTYLTCAFIGRWL